MTRWGAACAGAWLMLFDKLLDYMDIPHSIVIGTASNFCVCVFFFSSWLLAADRS